MTDILVRPARESDQPALVRLVDEWLGRPTHQQLPRLWLQHFAGTSFVAEDGSGRPVGLAVGFVSQDRPAEAYLHLLGVAPGQRRRGVGRALAGAFGEAVAARGARTVTTIAWPGEPGCLRFLGALGFTVDAGPGTRRLYGTPARTDWNREGDDQVVLTRSS
jgi:GNAT superfamily N-acetyltransferase